MDPVRFTIAVVPLAAYLGVLGLMQLRPRPLVTNGASDIMALGLGLLGLMFVGPIELFRPEMATAQFLNYIWLVLLALYALVLVLVALVSRPRLVIYNLTPEELRPMLSEAAGTADATFRWAGDSLVLPRLGVQLHVDSFALLRNTSLISSGPLQSLDGWRKLGKQLRASLRATQVGPRPQALVMVVLALFLLVVCEYRLATSSAQVGEAMAELFAFGWQRG
ncbi:MAG: hypothetical protein ACR2NU_06915 [Aeoliella sp.]